MTGNLSDDSASSPKDGSSLVKWWKRFNSKKAAPLVSNVQPVASTSQLPVFGVSLQESLPYASIAISQVGPDKRAAIYGHIPVVVAKTGLYLKENGMCSLRWRAKFDIDAHADCKVQRRKVYSECLAQISG